MRRENIAVRFYFPDNLRKSSLLLSHVRDFTEIMEFDQLKHIPFSNGLDVVLIYKLLYVE